MGLVNIYIMIYETDWFAIEESEILLEPSPAEAINLQESSISISVIYES